MPLTASYGEEPAGHRGDNFVAHVEALGVDLSHLTSGNQVFGNGDVLGLLRERDLAGGNRQNFHHQHPTAASALSKGH